MSDANLHLVLIYVPIENLLIASFYDQYGNPVPGSVVIEAAYSVFLNDRLVSEIVGGNNQPIQIGDESQCADEYKVIAIYTVNGILQPATVASIILMQGIIINNGSISQHKNGHDSVNLQLILPISDSVLDITWTYNYESFVPTDPYNFNVHKNGIYEVLFVGASTNIYLATIEVVDTSPEMYIKIIGNDDNLYGVYGIPPNVKSIIFIPIDARSPYRYKIYVDGVRVSNNNFLSLTNLQPGSEIFVCVTDCCDIVLSADTSILSCGRSFSTQKNYKSRKLLKPPTPVKK